MPERGSGRPNCALLAAMRTSLAASSSQPPPSARPLIAAITGLYSGSPLSSILSPIAGSASRRSSTAFSGLRAPVHNGISPPRSPPQQKSRSPAPVSTATRMSRLSRTSCQVSASATKAAGLRVFRASGRLMVIHATAPRCS